MYITACVTAHGEAEEHVHVFSVHMPYIVVMVMDKTLHDNRTTGYMYNTFTFTTNDTFTFTTKNTYTKGYRCNYVSTCTCKKTGFSSDHGKQSNYGELHVHYVHTLEICPSYISHACIHLKSVLFTLFSNFACFIFCHQRNFLLYKYIVFSGKKVSFAKQLGSREVQLDHSADSSDVTSISFVMDSQR